MTKSFLASKNIKAVYHAHDSADFNSSDFFLFKRHKKMLSGKRFTYMSSISACDNSKRRLFFSFRILTERLLKYILVEGEYLEGLN
jgi:hypothetical protein